MTDATVTDTGTGYGRKPTSHDARLTEVGPGTPMGEALRRYWHPVASSDALTSDVPHRTRVLGEDLIAFRDGHGRPGVVYERCAHRGSSLFYGRVEEDGIRCCYHGWKFDVQGHCLDQACELDGGRRRNLARQPWYPVEERYGLVFVYMGPPEHKPPLPRWDCFEPLEEGDSYHATWPVPGAEVTGLEQDFNWLQFYENAVDPVHASWLHSQHSGFQFQGTGTTGFPEDYYDPRTVAERVTYHRTDLGMKYFQRYQDKTGADSALVDVDWSVELQLPNIIALPDFVNVTPDARHDLLIWVVPVDDTHNRLFFCARSADATRIATFAFGIKQNGKDNWEMAEDEKQRFPGDYEAQRSQGDITQHSEETLAPSDRGVVMLRRMLRTMMDDVEGGRVPLGVAAPDEPVRHVEAGVFTRVASQGDGPAAAGAGA
ncbi:MULTISPECIES: Rieske 2Fe-2S domain-containing protein [unclassified Streptomyces]|uniref:Rieske 2Fe-2S domain-containing protein n=1 Tax=unclassified Streptomyces TaxID=2593676 RepID=UPI00224F6106|nr:MULTISPECIES: Rieske 2Fe-2S domain-containing protein [unclassified Streptomyces]MCX4641960.1 Rieske 2Fe-2S domain-containing protein [Streptomyces sp. NBC_01446]MCX5085695.1 Rieske 2Fe-2S domain-containing protein [Streptomyces sp. NBC_00401]